MALQDKYVNADVVAQKEPIPGFIGPGQHWGGIATVEVAGADDANSLYRIFKGVPSDVVLKELLLDNDAFGAAGALDIGVYESKVAGEVYDADCWANELAIVNAAKRVNAMPDLDAADCQKRMFELAGHTISTKKPHYDIVAKITVKGATGLGTLSFRAEFLQT